MNGKTRDWGRALFLIIIIVPMALVACGSADTSDAELGSSTEGGGGTGITSTFGSPSEMGVGDIMPIEFGEATSVSVDFSGVESGTNFILAVGSYNTSGSGTSMQLAAALAAPVEASLTKGIALDEDIEDGGFGPGEIMDAWLRASESELPFTEMPLRQMGETRAFKAISAKATLGATETFRILASLSSTSSYAEVSGRARCVGTNTVFYVDTTVGSDSISDSDITTLCNEFDSVAGEEQGLMGGTSDVDRDGKLHVLMTPQINRLGAMGGGIITGYFYAGDLYEQSTSNPTSNHREIIYVLSPDPTGRYGTAISKEFAMSNLLPAVLPHELQHAISYNQHVFVGGGVSEENWLNEAVSHLAEDILGYGVENPSRYAMYLASPSTYGVVTQGSPNLMERGAAYLFLRFLYEQASSGSGFLKDLVSTSSRGVDNLEAAFAGPSNMNEFSEFMARWTIALAMTDRGLTQDARYIYRSRAQNSSTGNWEGVTMEGDAEDGRDTVLEGVHLNQYYGYHSPSIDASAAIFYDVTTPPSTMTISGTQGGGNFGVLIRSQ